MLSLVSAGLPRTVPAVCPRLLHAWLSGWGPRRKRSLLWSQHAAVPPRWVRGTATLTHDPGSPVCVCRSQRCSPPPVRLLPLLSRPQDAPTAAVPPHWAPQHSVLQGRTERVCVSVCKCVWDNWCVPVQQDHFSGQGGGLNPLPAGGAAGMYNTFAQSSSAVSFHDDQVRGPSRLTFTLSPPAGSGVTRLPLLSTSWKPHPSHHPR